MSRYNRYEDEDDYRERKLLLEQEKWEEDQMQKRRNQQDIAVFNEDMIDDNPIEE